MKRIAEYRKLFNITKETELAELKLIYRGLVKEFHPDKFTDEELKAQAELKSKTIIEAYHFLVSIAHETIESTLEEYTKTTTTSNIADINYKGKRLRIDFTDGSGYEYYGVPENTFSKLINADSQGRFARRHIYTSFLYRNVSKLGVTV